MRTTTTVMKNKLKILQCQRVIPVLKSQTSVKDQFSFFLLKAFFKKMLYYQMTKNNALNRNLTHMINN